VLIAADGGGSCWYWWPWATQIAPVGDTALAADRVTIVLRASDLTALPTD
jgi:hypothetical protein